MCVDNKYDGVFVVHLEADLVLRLLQEVEKMSVNSLYTIMLTKIECITIISMQRQWCMQKNSLTCGGWNMFSVLYNFI